MAGVPRYLLSLTYLLIIFNIIGVQFFGCETQIKQTMLGKTINFSIGTNFLMKNRFFLNLKKKILMSFKAIIITLFCYFLRIVSTLMTMSCLNADP